MEVEAIDDEDSAVDYERDQRPYNCICNGKKRHLRAGRWMGASGQSVSQPASRTASLRSSSRGPNRRGGGECKTLSDRRLNVLDALRSTHLS